MRYAGLLPPFVALGLGACHGQAEPHLGAAALDSIHAAAITDSVRAFAESVARGVTARGPAAWRAYFAAEPAFFKASEGRLVFPNSDSAARAITTLSQPIAKIELAWGEPLRIDPLAPGVALLAAPYHELRVDTLGRRVEEDGFLTAIVEHGPAGWQFRNAHWSVVAPPSVVP